jgi:hypothetical protein
MVRTIFQHKFMPWQTHGNQWQYKLLHRKLHISILCIIVYARSAMKSGLALAVGPVSVGSVKLGA